MIYVCICMYVKLYFEYYFNSLVQVGLSFNLCRFFLAASLPEYITSPPEYITSSSERYARSRAKPGPGRLVYTILAKMSVCVCVCVSRRISRKRNPFSVRKTSGDKVGQRA